MKPVGFPIPHLDDVTELLTSTELAIILVALGKLVGSTHLIETPDIAALYRKLGGVNWGMYARKVH